ncbi:MAG: hypothetical protein KDD45_05025 [Bdellovibrionales bacterium]|nr:hypothetical protein [Bdellovibrionales bacterium]
MIWRHYSNRQNSDNLNSDDPISRLANVKNQLHDYIVFIQFFPILGAIVFAVCIGRVVDSTTLLLSFNWKNTYPDLLAIFFWGLLIVWVLVTFRYSKLEDHSLHKRFKEILLAIYHAPSYQLFYSYPEIIESLSLRLQEIETREKLEPQQRVILSINIILLHVIDVVGYFSDAKDSQNEMGANIMLFVKKDEYKDLFEDLFSRSTFSSGLSKEKLQGFLLLPLELSIRFGEQNDTYQQIILEIPSEPQIDGIQEVMPGAPWAAFNGISNQKDTSTIENDINGASQRVIQAVNEYFGESGPGNFIKSFLSIRLQRDAAIPIGIVNVDYKKTNILANNDYLQTLYCLVTPLLQRLVPFVEKFAYHYLQEESQKLKH